MLEISSPATAGTSASKELHTIIPIENKNLAYDYWIGANDDREHAKKLLQDMLKSAK